MQKKSDLLLEQIPKEWKYETIEDCCNILDSKRIPLNSEERKKIKGDIPYYGANGVQGHINKHIFNEDLILLAEDGGYFTEYRTRPIAYYVTGKCWVNNHAHVLNAKNSNNIKWIFYSLVHKNIIPWIIGSTRTKLNQSQLRKIIIPIPPIQEQQKITSILSRVDELIQKIEQIIEQTQRLKRGLMQRLLIKGIGHTKFKNTEFGSSFIKYDIPVEWIVNSVKNLCTKLVVSYVGTCDPYYTENDGIPMIRTTNVKEGYLELSNLKYVTKEFHEKNKKSQLQQNDLIIARHGQNGTACLVRGIKEANALSVVIVRPDPTLWNPDYFELAFNSNIVRKQMGKNTAGGVQTVVNTAEVGKALICLPSKEEQNKIVSVFFTVRDTLDNIKEQRKILLELKKGLMQQLLTGRIRAKV